MYDNHITTVGVMFKTEAQTSRVDWTYIYIYIRHVMET